MSAAQRRVPTEAEWQRLNVVFGTFFAITVAVAAMFMFASPFPPIVGGIIMSPVVVPTGWIYIMVIRQRDVDRLARLNAFAMRHRRRPRRRR
ncbi:MAG TPA: hypothetical protein VG034_20265 [Acidimicrobiia bacterium]|jgi:hypothetical protein|nr:hypothetical protein [Acidimicrobiia bacterium]